MRIRGKILWLILCLAGLVPALLPGTALAQEEKIDISLRLIPGDYDKEVIPGEETVLHLEIHNNGNKPVTNIGLSSEPPEDWDIEFDPAVIDYLGTGTFQTVDINVRPSRSAGKGEYRITIVAEANETRRITTTFLRVESATTIWTWVGIAIAALVVAGFIIVYKRIEQQQARRKIN